jgi:hypothetical protein
MTTLEPYTFPTAAVQLAAACWLVVRAAVDFAGATVKGAVAVTGAVTTLVKGTPAPIPIADDWVDLDPPTLLDEVQESDNLELPPADSNTISAVHP